MSMDNTAKKNVLPHVVVLATGGTIAGTAGSDTQMTGYKAGDVTVEALLNTIPAINDMARVSGEQIANIDSKDMTEDIMLKLSCRCNELLEDEDVSAIVITHGTDTMEETAYFLNLTVHSNKPVVLTGAMRPSTAISADGPANILNAVKVAIDSKAVGKGVMIVMNDDILPARDAVKSNTSNLATFVSANGCKLGTVIGGEPRFYAGICRKHTVDSEFAVDGDTKLPKVFIIYGHSSDGPELIDAAVAAGAKGIVYAGMGMGSIHKDAEPALLRAKQAGVAVVRSSRVFSGIVAEGIREWTEAGFLNGDSLSPCKVRILLQLGLMVTSDGGRLQEMLLEY